MNSANATLRNLIPFEKHELKSLVMDKVQDNVTKALDNIIELPFSLDSKDLYWANGLFKNVEFHSTPITGNINVTLQHPRVKVYEFIEDKLIGKKIRSGH